MEFESSGLVSLQYLKRRENVQFLLFGNISILDFSKLESGSVDFVFRATEVMQLLRTAIESIAFQAQNKQLALRIDSLVEDIIDDR